MKKVLAIVLAALLIVTALAGCAAKSETADTAADSTTTDTAAAETTDGKLDSVSMAVLAIAVTALSGAYCDRKMAAPKDSGTLMSSVRISR